MIRTIAMLAAAAAVLAVSPPALAQQQQQREGVRVGLGLGMNVNQLVQPTNLNFTGLPPVALYVPIQISSQFRVEPWLGFWTFSQNDFPGRVGDMSNHVWDIGVGGLWYFQPATPLGLYLGGRLALTFSGAEIDPGVTASETDFRIHAVGGAEYFIAQRFSFGAELQVGPTFYGDPSVEAAGVTTTPSRNLVSWQTNGVLFFRYFL
ncbi:MAG TPA: outer membrane beta-barrel protein [Anaeromyxobacteraceae bacterium]|nr:outer membrane beta-barrel protein [Anaeromyxobacteraceae bacterium]